jgi:hypothetical protein
MAISSRVPGFDNSVGTLHKATPVFKVGENVPLVTSPTGVPSFKTL